MKYLSILTIIGIIISIIVIVLLYKYIKKRKGKIEGMKGRSIPTKALTEADPPFEIIFSIYQYCQKNPSFISPIILLTLYYKNTNQCDVST